MVFILFIMKEASKTREETCCFTGHRKIPEEEREQLARRLEATVEELIRAGVRYFVAGGALGFDTINGDFYRSEDLKDTDLIDNMI